jgi:signal peptidase I
MNSFFNKILFGGGVLFDLCKWVILFVVVVILIVKFWFTFFIVDGISMEPNLHDKEIVLLKVSAYNSADPKRGDVVAVKYPGDPEHKKYVKRVVGLPGEKIEIKNDQVYIDGKLDVEEFLPYGTQTRPDKAWQLSSIEYFLMGDNRPGSNDSRYFGPVEKRFITGEATTIVFPRFRQILR